MPAARPVPDSVLDRLWAAGCVAADEEAEELWAAAPDDATVEAWLRRREQGEPLAWITGTLPFCGRTLRVDPGVYVPRYQTEDLARRAATLLAAATAAAATAAAAAGPGAARAVDLCTGAGAIAAHLRAEVPGAAVVGVDIDPLAVACARRNGVPAVQADLDRPPLRTAAFDLVTAVAPYVPTGEMAFLPADVQRYEPRRALDGGDDGLDLVRRVVAAAGRLLRRPGGWLLTEVGGDQHDLLRPALDAAGFGPATPWFDEDGDLRGLAAPVR
ncbi:MAG TPA: methyltransferase domain-containing protein [Acidimicrobiales bacterium]|nr:methyltransferase domain-containing protein [Acidimicrobiales bacterium]